MVLRGRVLSPNSLPRPPPSKKQTTTYPDYPKFLVPTAGPAKKKVEQILPSLSPNAHTPPKIIRTVRFELFVGGRGAGLSWEVGQKH